MDRLSLPEPARALWRRIAGAMDRALEHLDAGAERWRMGGGTVLAARWRHRESTDIDLTVPGHVDISVLRNDHRTGFPSAMKELGAQYMALGLQHHTIEFEQSRRLDITAIDSRPAAGHIPAACGSTTVFAMSSTQILRGKLERSLLHEPPARDLFDFAVAARSAPAALCHALNMLPVSSIRLVVDKCEQSRHRMRYAAENDLTNVRPDCANLLHDLADRARRSLLDARYVRTEVERTDDHILIVTTTAGGRRHEIRISPANLEDVIERTGLNAYFRTQADALTPPLERLVDVVRTPHAGRTVLTGAASEEMR